MAEIPIPTVQEAGQGVSWFASQAGIVATVEAVFIAVLIAAVVGCVKYFGAQTRDAWVRVTAISEARTADSKAGDDAINKNTLAMTILSERLNSRNN